MPELPDVAVYIDRLAARVVGRRLEAVRLLSPFLLRTAVPPIGEAIGRTVQGVERIGKRIVLALDGDLFIVVHLMIAGRLLWLAPGKSTARNALAFLAFDNGTLALTEAGSKRRASIHVVQGRAALQALDAGGIDVLGASREAFAERLVSENHTLKRALTDPRLFSGIGNAYSDEILHAARLSPLQLTSRLDDAEIARLHAATRDTLLAWTERLRRETGDDFPETVTAFHEEMAVHGRFGKPCPDCGSPVQRIRYASNETNYCAKCQTGGRLLADRAMSRLLKKDWPRTLEELEG